MNDVKRHDCPCCTCVLTPGTFEHALRHMQAFPGTTWRGNVHPFRWVKGRLVVGLGEAGCGWEPNPFSSQELEKMKWERL